jgi:hypothetical protein
MKVENECKAPEQHKRSSSDFYREGREVQETKKIRVAEEMPKRGKRENVKSQRGKEFFQKGSSKIEEVK